MHERFAMTPIPVLPVPVPPRNMPMPPSDDARLHAAARKLEATFLSEMLKSAGLEGAQGAFGGGAGEDHFQSYLRDAQAEELVNAGGIGLAESLFNAMKARTHA